MFVTCNLKKGYKVVDRFKNCDIDTKNSVYKAIGSMISWLQQVTNGNKR